MIVSDKMELESKQKTIDNSFNILHNAKYVIKYTTKQLLLYKNSAVKSLTENARANSSANYIMFFHC